MRTVEATARAQNFNWDFISTPPSPEAGIWKGDLGLEIHIPCFGEYSLTRGELILRDCEPASPEAKIFNPGSILATFGVKSSIPTSKPRSFQPLISSYSKSLKLLVPFTFLLGLLWACVWHSVLISANGILSSLTEEALLSLNCKLADIWSLCNQREQQNNVSTHSEPKKFSKVSVQ